ncbi:MAG: Fe-S cluster assembly ATPase SufC [Bacilli bacterium]|nr:Fe-S cluster assembly ATPase SufC [Bacilli bacterium]MDD3304713.1 Fe-S cluster assembly ATPase SufC [Bacilli bacterium]MDD4053608.1 Fe-S cluster assembly ATPase SufC [Bacilli bacterium]MDD4411107.1 Fe-S cluster assembly ATPase SufC [Bacilli bacterium]
MLLKIDDLSVMIDDKQILNNYNLEIKPGEIHVIMGPNGSGKSTLSKTIMGDQHYKVTNGSILFDGQDIKDIKTDERARLGIFLAMQSPMEIEGVSNSDFLRTALSIKNEGKLNLYQFAKKTEAITNDLKMDKNMIHRSVNVGFSGGERKKNEILQMKLLEPKLIILDEIDSGLDIDSLRIVAENINDYRNDYPDTAVIIITHHQKILDYIKPLYVHIMTGGKIVKTGDYKLALELEKHGFDFTFNTTNDLVGEDAIKENENDE